MKKHHVLILLLCLVLFFVGCGKTAPQPEAPTDLTTSAAVTTITSTTKTTTAEDTSVSSGDGLTETGEWLFNNGFEDEYYVRLPDGMYLRSSTIYDANRSHLVSSDAVSAGAPYKVGELLAIREMGFGKTPKGFADEYLADKGEGLEMQEELREAGEFEGQRGNQINYLVIESETLNPYLYHFWIELDETHAAHIWFWEPEYNPETDLPRFKEIAASVRP